MPVESIVASAEDVDGLSLSLKSFLASEKVPLVVMWGTRKAMEGFLQRAVYVDVMPLLRRARDFLRGA